MNRQRLLWNVSVGAAVAAAGCQAPPTTSPVTQERGVSATADAQPDTLHPRVKFETSLGDIVFELDGENAPGTVLNLVQYVQSGFYEGTVFHRVLKDTMIQGGEFTADMEPKLLGLRPGPEGAWLSKLTNKRGAVAMIRGRGAGGPASGQFYINIADNPNLDERQWQKVFSVCGRVVEGMDTVEKIRNVPVGPHEKYAEGRSAVVPIRPVVVKSTKLLTPYDPIGLQAVLIAYENEEAGLVDNLVGEIEEQASAKAVTTESGLRYVDFVVGTGASPLPSSSIQFQYRGTLIDGTVFESTYEAEPAVRELALLIPGLKEGLTTMSEGGRRTVVVPPELGFGKVGVPGLIPPDSVLVFEIELLEVK